MIEDVEVNVAGELSCGVGPLVKGIAPCGGSKGAEVFGVSCKEPMVPAPVVQYLSSDDTLPRALGSSI